MDQRYFVVLGACLTQFVVIGLLFCYGLLLPVLEAEFGWSRTTLSAVNSLGFLLMGVLAIPLGGLSDRLGPRLVLGVAGLVYGIGWMLMGQISEIWHLVVIFSVFIAVGIGAHDVVTLGTIARWFERRRGIMSGVVKVGTALGQMSIPPLAAMLLLSLGWRDTLFWMGLAAVCLLISAALLMRAAPQREGFAGAAVGPSFEEARSSRIFWTVCAIQLLFFSVVTTIPLHIVVHGMDLGLTPTTAATLLTVLAAASIFGRLLIGRFVDKIGGQRGYQLCLLPLIASLLALIVVESHSLLFAVMVVYGFAHGGLFTVVSPSLAEFFGTRAHGALFGVVLFFGTIGGAIGPIVAGWSFDVLGSYSFAFAALAVSCMIGLALTFTLPRLEG